VLNSLIKRIEKKRIFRSVKTRKTSYKLNSASQKKLWLIKSRDSSITSRV